MDHSAHNPPLHHKNQILIINAGSYLGSQLADFFLQQNFSVYATGNSNLLHRLIEKDNFTLLEIDLAQPLPSHLPQFNFIIYIAPQFKNQQSISQIKLDIQNIISFAQKNQTNTFFCLPINHHQGLSEYILSENSTSKLFKLFLVGDLYGPKMPLDHAQSDHQTLGDLISQAINTDKIILKNEGLNIIYPAYITDAVWGIYTNIISPDPKESIAVASESAKTALSIAYEIQNVLNLSIKKSIGLFFAGPQAPNQVPETTIKYHLNFDAKIETPKGLAQTFEYFQKHNLVDEKQYQPQTPPKVEFDNSDNKQEEEITKSPQLFQKIKHTFTFSKQKRPKFIALSLVILLLITIGKTSFDLYFGTRNLKKVKTYLESGDLAKAKKYSSSAYKSLHSAKTEIKILTWPLTIVAKGKTAKINQTLSAGVNMAESSKYFVSAGEKLTKNLEIIIGKNKKDTIDIESPSADLKKSYLLSSQSIQDISSLSSAPFVKNLNDTKEMLKQYNKLTLSLLEMTNSTYDFVGKDTPRTYLVLMQNNTELRPGGGFIGNFATIEFEKSTLKNIKVEDIYQIDGQLIEKIEPPTPLKEKLGVAQLYLRDSNWSGDFSINAQTAQNLYKKETGNNVDGIIAIDLTFVQNLLKHIGTIELKDYSEQINSENLFEKGEYYSEVGFTPGSTQKKDFFSALTKNLIDKIIQDSTISSAAIFNTSQNALQTKDVMVAFNDEKLTSIVKKHNWDHPLPPPLFDPADNSSATRDFLALVEANVGANKVNRQIERKIKYEMTIGKEADLVGKLSITYTNNSQAETWPLGKYVNYLRVYVPAGAGLFAYSNGQSTDIKEVTSTTQDNLTIFSTYVEVPVKSTKEVTFTYRISKNINLESLPTYHLYVQKQAGTLADPFEFIFNLPNYLVEKQSKKQNLQFSTNLHTDKEFKFTISKK